MAKKIEKPAIIKAAGNREKIIREYFGRVNSSTDEVSIAHMTSPEGWEEPAQCPEFNEYTLVLKGVIVVKTAAKEFIIREGEAILTEKGEKVRYSTPFPGGADYIAVCLPAFAPDTVHRDD